MCNLFRQWGMCSENTHVQYPISFTKLSVVVMTHTTNSRGDYKIFNVLNHNLTGFDSNVNSSGSSNYIVIGV